MAEMIYSLLFVGVGILGLVLSIKALDPAFAKKYIYTNPKAWFLKKLLGTEKATNIISKIFISLGIVISLVFIILGIILFTI